MSRRSTFQTKASKVLLYSMFTINSHHRLILLAIWFLNTVGCSQPDAADRNAQSATAATEAGASAGSADAGEPTPLPNLLQISKKFMTGGEPKSDEAFAELARLGVKTIVSVDGAKPDLKRAHEQGLRYVHIPIGYDGVESEAGQTLARLVREAEGPFYIHCHHGRHRGPTAAAIACVAASELDGKGALKILERAGTSKDYAGLWRDVENYQVPGIDVELPELVESAEVGSFAAAMAKIDRAYDNLKLCRDAGWIAPPDHPDQVPAREALLLKEGVRESARNLVEQRDDEFKTWLAEAESVAQQLEDALMQGHAEQATPLMQNLSNSCKQCHAKYRN